MLVDKNLKDFLFETASDNPAPGGGSVAALCGSLGAALGTMVCNLTIGREKYKEFEEDFKKAKPELENNIGKLQKLIDDDTNAFNDVMTAFKLPKETDEQKTARAEAIQKGYKKAISVPLETAQTALKTLSFMELIVSKGNQNAITDGAVGALASETAIKGALLNIKINLTSIKDQNYVNDVKKTISEIETSMNNYLQKIMSIVEKALN